MEEGPLQRSGRWSNFIRSRKFLIFWPLSWRRETEWTSITVVPNRLTGTAPPPVIPGMSESPRMSNRERPDKGTSLSLWDRQRNWRGLHPRPSRLRAAGLLHPSAGGLGRLRGLPLPLPLPPRVEGPVIHSKIGGEGGGTSQKFPMMVGSTTGERWEGRERQRQGKR